MPPHKRQIQLLLLKHTTSRAKRGQHHDNMSSYTSLRGQFEEGFRYGVATLPFYAILCIAAGVLSLVLCCAVRQQRDPARSYLNWLRCTFGLFVL